MLKLTVMSWMFVMSSIILEMMLNVPMVVVVVVQNALRIGAVEHVPTLKLIRDIVRYG